MDEPFWHCEYSVEPRVSLAFAWSYWTDVRNWADPPAEFSLEGDFAPGSEGTTRMPGQEPLRWRIAGVQPPHSAKIQLPLDGASISFNWRLEPLPDGCTRITQRVELTGQNAKSYVDACAPFAANLPGGMQRLAAAMEIAAGL